VRNATQFAQWNLQPALRLATLNPARVGGLKGAGQVKAGARADLVTLSPDGEIRNTIIGGAGV
jgi:N-acetylglucosamine-6-phosphate deacetylase